VIGDPATDGQIPLAGLVLDAGGNLYGTTDLGGANGVGTVFELSPGEDGRWIETILHSFNNNGSDGYLPSSNLIFDASGNLYGTTPKGGTGNCRDRDGVFLGCGTVFEVSPGTGGWTETVLHSFENTPADGQFPISGVARDASGNLYGTTASNINKSDNAGGTLYKITRVCVLSSSGGKGRGAAVM
jgi:uncharacterized repeat protein (TIGR03803 family)